VCLILYVCFKQKNFHRAREQSYTHSTMEEKGSKYPEKRDYFLPFFAVLVAGFVVLALGVVAFFM
jgi:Ca2+/Na+ antiporter